MGIPSQIRAGDSIAWQENPVPHGLSGTISSPDWALTYVLRGSVGLTVTGTANGGGWLVSITKTQSATLTPGGYSWQAVATKGDERITLGSGQIEVLQNLAFTGTAEAFDGRSQAQQDLEAVRAAMRAIVTGGATQEYSIGNRSLKKMPMADLIALETKLKADVVLEQRRKRIADGLDSGRATYIRFGR